MILHNRSIVDYLSLKPFIAIHNQNYAQSWTIFKVTIDYPLSMIKQSIMHISFQKFTSPPFKSSGNIQVSKYI